ncbi:MAG: S26 family signal peptidase [Alistipes indistinctus]
MDKRENYIKRAVALPGDTLQVIHSDVFVNGQPQTASRTNSMFISSGRTVR